MGILTSACKLISLFGRCPSSLLYAWVGDYRLSVLLKRCSKRIVSVNVTHVNFYCYYYYCCLLQITMKWGSDSPGSRQPHSHLNWIRQMHPHYCGGGTLHHHVLKITKTCTVRSRQHKPGLLVQTTLGVSNCARDLRFQTIPQGKQRAQECISSSKSTQTMHLHSPLSTNSSNWNWLSDVVMETTIYALLQVAGSLLLPGRLLPGQIRLQEDTPRQCAPTSIRSQALSISWAPSQNMWCSYSPVGISH